MLVLPNNDHVLRRVALIFHRIYRMASDIFVINFISYYFWQCVCASLAESKRYRVERKQTRRDARHRRFVDDTTNTLAHTPPAHVRQAIRTYVYIYHYKNGAHLILYMCFRVSNVVHVFETAVYVMTIKY